MNAAINRCTVVQVFIYFCKPDKMPSLRQVLYVLVYLHRYYSLYIFQAAFGWWSLKEERGWVPEADSWFLFREVQFRAGRPAWNLCLHSLSVQTGRPYFHTQVLSKENLLQRPLAEGTTQWKPNSLLLLHASAGHIITLSQAQGVLEKTVHCLYRARELYIY